MINSWLDKGIGGFRLDVIDLIGKEIDKGIFGNGPRLHPLLKEINMKTFGNYDVMTVGETWGATPEIATLYSAPNRQELSMIFQFEHMVLDWGNLGKWTPKKLDFIQLKTILSKWQKELVNGWNSLFWNNHDLPRIVSRWGNDNTYRIESSKMLAITLHMMKGTPYIYQGEEIGMTNIKFDSIEDYNDVEIHGFYKDYVLDQMIMSHDDFMNGVYKMRRDNARTPFQWNNQKEAGFTNGTPWLKVNPNYLEINAENAIDDKNSIFYTYKKLIQMRKSSKYSDVILYGDYEQLLENHPNIFAYKRYYKNQELLVLSNFTSEIITLEIQLQNYELLISNYNDFDPNTLRPYESIIFAIYN